MVTGEGGGGKAKGNQNSEIVQPWGLGGSGTSAGGPGNFAASTKGTAERASQKESWFRKKEGVKRHLDMSRFARK